VSAPRVWIGPEPNDAIAAAVERGGGEIVKSPAEGDGFIWLSWSRAADISELLHDGVRWVQLPSAGVDRWFAQGLLDDRRKWTGAQGAYADDVAEHVLAFLLAAARQLPQAAKRRTWAAGEGLRVAGSTVGIVGAGGIGEAVLRRLTPFGARILALTRSGREVPGADRSLSSDDLDELLAESEYVVLALPLTGESRGLIGARELDLIGPRGWLLNVARGALVDTDALVDALRAGRIAGACLDVTDPEPLPDGHPLWDLDNVLVTPHVANPPQLEIDALAPRVEENVRRFAAGEELLGHIDLARGY
jgi:phosphoglycerate dehydrogenase-like enzyme